MSLLPAHWHNCTFESFLIRMSNLQNHYYSTTIHSTTGHWKQGSKPEELKLSLVTFCSRVIEFWNVEHEIERFMWFQQVLTRHVTPCIFTVNSHNYRISMFNVTIHVHYNCQMGESSVISEIPTNPTKKTYLRLEARILNTTLTNHGSAHYKKIYKWKTARTSTTYRI